MIHSWGKGGESLGICGSSNNLRRWFSLFHPSRSVLYPAERFASKDSNPFVGYEVSLANIALPITTYALHVWVVLGVQHSGAGAATSGTVHGIQITSSLMWAWDNLVRVC